MPTPTPAQMGQSQPSPNSNSNNDEYDNNNLDIDANNNDNNNNNDDNKITNIKITNTLTYLLTSMIIIGITLWRVREEGVFGDEFLWMKYQTLLSPPNYTKYIWYPIFILQGLFIYASCLHKTYQKSPLVGYDVVMNGTTTNGSFMDKSAAHAKCIATQFPLISILSLIMIICHDSGYIGFALLSCVLCVGVLMNVLRIQGNALADDGDDSTKDIENTSSSDTMKDTVLKDLACQYVALRLPFELLGGYMLAMLALYVSMFLDTFVDGGMVNLIVANASLVGLLAVGYVVLWKIRAEHGHKFYGVGAGLVWYMLGVTIELQDPTQPIYNAYTDAGILTTQIVAGVSTTILMTMLGVCFNKTMIKYNVFNCANALGGNADSVFTEEDEMSTDYVHA